MKKILFTNIFLLCIMFYAKAQTTIIQTVAPPKFIFRPQKGLDNTATTFNTFLINEWLPGVIRLQDGRSYETYKIKFNAAAQILMYLNINQAMEVDENIKSFSITTTNGLERTFVNATEYGEKKMPLYFEVLLDDAKGTLLCSYKRTKAFGSENVLNGDNPQNSDLVTSYYFYKTDTKSLISLKKPKKQIAEFLNLTAEQEKALNFNEMKFNGAEDIMTFFSNYYLLK